MSCIKSFFKCHFSEQSDKTNNSWWDENITFFRKRIIDLELDVKAMKVAHDLEIKRIEDKLISSMNTLSAKIDTMMVLINSR